MEQFEGVVFIIVAVVSSVGVAIRVCLAEISTVREAIETFRKQKQQS